MMVTWVQRFNALMTIVWLVLIPISVFTPLKQSISWVVLMSVWANFAAHFSAWIGARIQRHQRDQEEQED